MRRSFLGVALGSGAIILLSVASIPACGGTSGSSFGGDGGASGSSSGGGAGGSGASVSGGSLVSGGTLGGGSGGGGSSASGGSSETVGCPAGLQCDVACSGGNTTTITGRVYDPAAKDPLYGIQVYVPAVPLTPLSKGVPTGADACSCGALYPSGAVVATTTDVNGEFTLKNAPVGSSVPLVLQVGKWRRSLKINVKACDANAQTDKSLTLPGTIASGDTDDNMPDIAVSTGSADSLECLLVRIGVSTSEYVPGSSTAGHVHVFSGGDPGGGGGGGGHHGGGGGGMVGQPETVPMASAPESFNATKGLWANQGQLMPYDVVLLSCEGGETYDANPAALESYLNAGGRAFASHFHYSWFSGPISSTGTNTYSAPSDWSNLAKWTADTGGFGGGLTGGAAVGGDINLTLNGSTQPFSKGVLLDTWLDENNALGNANPTKNVSNTQLPIYQPRYNASVGPANTPSQPWITVTGQTSPTLYFSFDTPVGAAADKVCGRAVFSDLHVSGNPSTNDNESKPPPASCDKVDLSPQEKALEFMLFDLSSCVIPDTVTVSSDAGLPPPPPMAK